MIFTVNSQNEGMKWHTALCAFFLKVLNDKLCLMISFADTGKV